MLGENMKRYRGVVAFRYYQQVEVEAENEDEAEQLMYAEFRMSRADGESEILDFEEIKE
jgi:hypothetical protein